MNHENPNPNQYPLGEPSVLDYVKSLFRFGNGERIQIPEFVEEESLYTESFPELEALPEISVAGQPITLQPANIPSAFPWRSLLAFFLALIGQRLFEPPAGASVLGYAFY